MIHRQSNIHTVQVKWVCEKQAGVVKRHSKSQTIKSAVVQPGSPLGNLLGITLEAEAAYAGRVKAF